MFSLDPTQLAPIDQDRWDWVEDLGSGIQNQRTRKYLIIFFIQVAVVPAAP
jgi:hypothetical protein